MEKLIRQFLEYIELERGHSQLTIRNYDAYLHKFMAFATENGIEKVEEISLEIIRKWRLELHRKGLSNKTMNYYMISIRSFLKYLSKIDTKSLSPEKIELADTPERQIAFLENEEIKRILKAFQGVDNLEIRNRAILELLFSTGMRVSEIASLNRDEINIERGEFSISGKGGKRRVVFVSENAAEWLKKYLRTRLDGDVALFIKSAKGKDIDVRTKKELEDLGGRLTVRQIQRIVQEAARKAGIVKKVTPHVLRHTFATDILRAGADIRSVQGLLGHSSVTTTQAYTHITDKHLKEIYQKYHDKEESDDEDN